MFFPRRISKKKIVSMCFVYTKRPLQLWALRQSRPVGKCAVCNACAHGLAKGNCAQCNSCPHGRRKGACKLCNPVLQKPFSHVVCFLLFSFFWRRVAQYPSPLAFAVHIFCWRRYPSKIKLRPPFLPWTRGNGCEHGKLRDNCVTCSPCPHGKLKQNCKTCTGCNSVAQRASTF